MSKLRRKKKPTNVGVEIVGVAVCTSFPTQGQKPGNEPSEAEGIAESANRLRVYLDEIEALGAKRKQAKEAFNEACKKVNEIFKEYSRMTEEASKAAKAMKLYDDKITELRDILRKQGIKI